MSLKTTTLTRAAVSCHILVLTILEYRMKLWYFFNPSLPLSLPSSDTKGAGQQPDYSDTLRFRGPTC
jgi:hypothetical protein